MRLRDLIRDRLVWLYAAVVAVLFHRPLTTDTFFFRDVYLLFYPKKTLLASAFGSGTVPFWDPYTNGGMPFLASPSTSTFHPSNLLYAVLPMLTAFNLIPALHVFLCAAAAYWLGRTLGLTRAAAFVSGSVYAFAGYTLSAANLTAMLLGLPWIALTVGLTHRAIRDRRSLAPAAIAGAMPLLGGAAELTAMMFLTLAVFIAVLHRRVWPTALVIGFACGLALIQILPATSVIEQSSRSEKRTWEEFTGWSVHPARLGELIVPGFFGPTNRLDEPSYWGKGFESGGFPYILSIYVGLPALLLAVRGATRSGLPRALGLLALVAIALALGRWLPGFRLIYDWVPLVTIFRYPVKAMLIAILPLALLAGYGLDAADRTRWWLIASVCALLGWALWAGVASFDLLPEYRRMLLLSFVHTAIAAALFFLARTNAQRAAVVMLDLAIAGYGVNSYAPRSLYDEPPLASAVRALAGDGRFYAAPHDLVIRAPENDIKWLARSNLGALRGYTATAFSIPVTFHSDYDGLAPSRIVTLSRLVDLAAWPQKIGILDRAGVRAFVTPDRLPGGWEVEESELRLYANPTGAMARFVSDAVVLPHDRDALRWLFRSRDLSRVVLSAPAKPPANCGMAEVRRVSERMYAVDAPCRGFVVFAETWYDGWSATVDGVEVPLLRADYAFSAVNVEKGRHVIERRYTPPRLWIGVGGTLLFALMLPLLRRATS